MNAAMAGREKPLAICKTRWWKRSIYIQEEILGVRIGVLQAVLIRDDQLLPLGFPKLWFGDFGSSPST